MVLRGYLDAAAVLAHAATVARRGRLDSALDERSFNLASFKADQRPYLSSAANHVGAWALLFLPTCPAAADWTLLIDERSFFQKEYCLLHFSLKKNFAKTF